MPIRQYKPTTPGRRGASVNLHAEVTKTTPTTEAQQGLAVGSEQTGRFQMARQQGMRTAIYVSWTIAPMETD